jgi:hypothetical protein
LLKSTVAGLALPRQMAPKTLRIFLGSVVRDGSDIQEWASFSRFTTIGLDLANTREREME